MQTGLQFNQDEIKWSTGIVAEKNMKENSMTLEAIKNIANASDTIIDNLQRNAPVEEANTDPEAARKKRQFSITEAAKFVERTIGGIRKAEKLGNLVPPPMEANGRRGKYTLGQINKMREYWDCVPGRESTDHPIRMTFQNFKGGVGKTTLCCHFAQYLAIKGYKVLVIDADSQGSATITFGFKPDRDIDRDETLAPFLCFDEGFEDLEYAVKKTHWEGVDLIPSCLGLYGAEYALAGIAGDKDFTGGDWLARLGDGIETIEGNYDVILIDPPPALGMISLSVLRAIDGLIIPTPPAMYDFHSTSSFFHMLAEVMESMIEVVGEELELDFVKLVISKKQTGLHAHEMVHSVMAEAFGKNLLHNAFLQSAEINNASNDWKTVYDLDGPISSRSTYKRCKESMDEVFGEAERLINAVWQTRRAGQILANEEPDVSKTLRTVETEEVA